MQDEAGKLAAHGGEGCRKSEEAGKVAFGGRTVGMHSRV